MAELSRRESAVLAILTLSDEESSCDIRKMLAVSGDRMGVLGGPAFYQLLDRMEYEKLIEVRDVDRTVNGQVVQEKRYRITDHGLRRYVDEPPKPQPEPPIDW